MKAALQNYHARMQRVLDHIDRHLDDDLDLDALSSVAAYSKYHFHRQFTATFGLSVHRYIQLARMKRASYRLAYRDARNTFSEQFTPVVVGPPWEDSASPSSRPQSCCWSHRWVSR